MTEIKSGNLYASIPKDLPKEITETLAQSDNIRIERIVSKGHCSEPGFWYDQEQNEWVLLIKGEAELKFEKSEQTIRLAAGAYINIPAHIRHRVEWTKPDEETIWLVVFY
ncbi:MAG: cupin domain-containing protein [Gammaproteobacteria bacterium]